LFKTNKTVGGTNDGDESVKGGEHFLPVMFAKNIQSQLWEKCISGNEGSVENCGLSTVFI